MKPRATRGQLVLPLPGQVARRRRRPAASGSSRRPRKGGVPHRRREELDGRTPVHLTLRLLPGLPNLRKRKLFRVVRAALRAANGRESFRLVELSVQKDHLHFMIEAASKRALSRGAQGLAIRVARRVNRAVGRSGRVFAERYHARALRSPREVREALAYVLNNRKKHEAQRGVFWAPAAVDPCSSALVFAGWARPVHAVSDGLAREGPDRDDPAELALRVTVPARTWLLARGWLRHGQLDPGKVPSGADAIRHRPPKGW